MNQDERFLMLDINGDITELRGGVLNIGTLLGHTFAMYEALPGLCFAVSHTSSARYAEPNLHVSKFARTCSGIAEPFFGYAIFFGGIEREGQAASVLPLDPDNEQLLLRSVQRSKSWLALNQPAAESGVALADRIRRSRQITYGASRG